MPADNAHDPSRAPAPIATLWLPLLGGSVPDVLFVEFMLPVRCTGSLEPG